MLNRFYIPSLIDLKWDYACQETWNHDRLLHLCLTHAAVGELYSHANRYPGTPYVCAVAIKTDNYTEKVVSHAMSNLRVSNSHTKLLFSCAKTKSCLAQKQCMQNVLTIMTIVNVFNFHGLPKP